MFADYISRRTLLSQALKKQFPDKQGLVLLPAAFESERYPFRQDSSFYYFTGITEPGVIFLMQDGPKGILFTPQYGSARQQWVESGYDHTRLEEQAITQIRPLGAACKGYSLSPACVETEYEQFLSYLEQLVAQGMVLFTIYPERSFAPQSLMLDRLFLHKPQLAKAIVDISGIIAQLRRKKSKAELELLYEAVDITLQGQEAAASRIEEGLFEYQVSAALEFMFLELGARPAFPSIVAAGKNSTVLHYTKHDAELKRGNLVVVDIGAEKDYYCADITRTYPVSGTFSKRQREVYTIVLETQEYIASVAQPGYWLSNKNHPDKSLHHLAVEYLKDQGYDQYFPHGIGHFLGLDVHDVGDYAQPLEGGDVITIEPGIYIPKEELGIRIEDNYWITEQGAVCISEELPKDSHAIEDFMASELDFE